jgi:hypothetical protein
MLRKRAADDAPEDAQDPKRRHVDKGLDDDAPDFLVTLCHAHVAARETRKYADWIRDGYQLVTAVTEQDPLMTLSIYDDLPAAAWQHCLSSPDLEQAPFPYACALIYRYLCLHIDEARCRFKVSTPDSYWGALRLCVSLGLEDCDPNLPCLEHNPEWTHATSRHLAQARERQDHAMVRAVHRVIHLLETEHGVILHEMKAEPVPRVQTDARFPALTNICVAGGAAFWAVRSHLAVDPRSDVDLFVFGPDAETRRAAFQKLIRYFQDAVNGTWFVVYSTVVTVVIPGESRLYQIIFTDAVDVTAVLNGFDLMCVRYAIDQHGAHASTGACASFDDHMMYDFIHAQKLQRALKWVDRGFHAREDQDFERHPSGKWFIPPLHDPFPEQTAAILSGLYTGAAVTRNALDVIDGFSYAPLTKGQAYDDMSFPPEPDMVLPLQRVNTGFLVMGRVKRFKFATSVHVIKWSVCYISKQRSLLFTLDRVHVRLFKRENGHIMSINLSPGQVSLLQNMETRLNALLNSDESPFPGPGVTSVSLVKEGQQRNRECADRWPDTITAHVVLDELVVTNDRNKPAVLNPVRSSFDAVSLSIKISDVTHSAHATSVRLNVQSLVLPSAPDLVFVN